MRRGIARLSEVLIDQIAAGEVVERPSLVVKELVENSLDAGSSRIAVEIAGGGLERIVVADDGFGMTPEELRLSVTRHATSKISTLEHLHLVSTLGFRGEALPSIASVSRLQIVSRPENVPSGWRIVLEGGEETTFEPAAADVGTTITVTGLFFNTPARRKFLAGARAEGRAVSALLSAIALANTDVSVTLNVDGREVVSWPEADDLRSRAAQVFGRGRAEAMIPLEHAGPDVRITGLVGRPADAGGTRRNQIFIVNRRPVANRDLRNILSVGYGDLVPRGRFPHAVVDIALDPSQVDCNVHPRKTEVRFSDARRVHDRLLSAVRLAVAGLRTVPDLSRPSDRDASFPAEPTDGPERERTFGESERYGVSRAIRDYLVSAPSGGDSDSFVGKTLPFRPLASPDKNESGQAWTTETERIETTLPSGANLWQFQDSYVFAQVRDALIVIDQHAAHERVLYEEALASLTGAPAISQQLLFPIVFEVTPEERLALVEREDAILRLGFAAEPFEGSTVMVSAIPAALTESDGGRVFREVLSDLRASPRDADTVRRVAASYACHAAVRAGDALSTPEMAALVDRLFACEKPTACPHGRPTMIRIALSEIRRRFGRE
jgi:DNA mismatch repair protein MutL